MSTINDIKSRLEAFKRRFYVRQLIIGGLLFLIVAIGLFLVINGLEYRFWMNSVARTVLFFLSIATIVSLLAWWVGVPLSLLFRLRNGLSDEEAAHEIKKSFPEIQDRLLNTLQLSRLSSADDQLLQAAINKKAEGLKKISFSQAVDFSAGKKYGIILGSVVVCLVLVSFINPSVIKDGTSRMVRFNREFTPDAPFSFMVTNELEAFRGEDFTLEVQVEGSTVPEKVNLMDNSGTTSGLRKTGASTFSYVFPKIQRSQSFQLEGAGFYSDVFTITVNERPDLISMNISVVSPGYTGGERTTITNRGDLIVLEGSSVTWDIATLSADSLSFTYNSEALETTRLQENAFVAKERIFETGAYEIALFNEFGSNRSDLSYELEVIKDEYPGITAAYFPDSSRYKFITVAGSITDDHGFSELSLKYKKVGEGGFRAIPLDLAQNVKTQSFYASWNTDSLEMKVGARLEFYISVSDNDGVNGAKTTRSQTFVMEIPDRKKIDELIDKKAEGVENQLDRSKQEAESINERLKSIEEKLKTEQKFDWQEKKQLNDVIEEREKLTEEIQKLQKQHQDLQKSNEMFNKQSSRMQEQNQKLQELLDQLLDEETRKLYEELKKLLQEKNTSSDQIRQQVQEIQQNEKNLERELDRALELFKRLKMESSLSQNLQRLDTLSQKQEKVAEENTSDKDLEELAEEQKEIQEEFEEFREKMDEVEQLNQELKRPEPLLDLELQEQLIARDLREIQEQLEEMKQEQNNTESDPSKQQNQDQQQEQSDPENQGDQSDAENDPSEQQNQNQQQSGQEQNNTEKQEDQSDAEKDASEQQNQSQQQKQQQLRQKQKNAGQKMKQLSQKLSNMQSGMQMEMMQVNMDQLRDILDNLVKLSFNQEELMNEMRTVSQSDPRFLELSQQQLKLKDDAKVIQDSLLSLAKRVVQISSFITREVGNINKNIDESLDYLKDRNRGRALSTQQFAMTSINNLALLLDNTLQQMQMAMAEAMGNPQQGKKQNGGLPDLQELQNMMGEKIEELKGSGKQGRELSEELARLAAEQELIRRQLEMVKEAEDGKPGGGGGGDDLQKAIEQMEQNEIDLVNKRLTQQLISRQKEIVTRMLEAEKAQRQQENEEEREAESPSVISREIPPEFEEYLKLKQKEIELLKTIPIELNPFYKKEVNDYFRRISSDNKDD